MINPPAIIFSNNDLTPQGDDLLKRQLFLTDIQDGYQFVAEITANPSYADLIHMQNRRLLVKWDTPNLNLAHYADVIVFFSHGLCAIEKNIWGPHGYTVGLQFLYWNELCVF